MSEPDPLSALIEMARPEMDASDAELARLRSKMLRRVGPAVLAAAIPTTAAAGGAVTATGAGGMLKLLAVVSILGATGGGIVYAVRSPGPGSTPRESSAQPARSAAPALGPAQSPPATELPAPAPAASAVAIRGGAAMARTPTKVRPEPSDSTLADEYALVSRAQGALKAHDPSLALSLLNEHASRFPKGQLGEEREALRVLAICSLGGPDARSTAESFLRTRPSSSFALRIRAACDPKQ